MGVGWGWGVCVLFVCVCVWVRAFFLLLFWGWVGGWGSVFSSVQDGTYVL